MTQFKIKNSFQRFLIFFCLFYPAEIVHSSKNGDAAETLMIDSLNTGDSVAAGMPNRPARLIFGRGHTESSQIVFSTSSTMLVLLMVKAQSGQLIALLLAGILTTSAKDANQRVAKGFPKIFVEVSVNKRIESRIEVADPEEDLDDDVGTVTQFTAQRDAHVPDKER